MNPDTGYVTAQSHIMQPALNDVPSGGDNVNYIKWIMDQILHARSHLILKKNPLWFYDHQ